MAIAVADVLTQRGGQFPRDLSITGFDGIPQAVSRGITTVRQPSRLKGQESGDMLAQLIEESQQAQTVKSLQGARTQSARRVLLETSVVQGESVGPPRQGNLPF